MKLSVKYLLTLSLLSVSMASPAKQYSGITGTEYAEMRLLVGSSDYNIKLAAMSAFSRQRVDRDVLDLMADLAWAACKKEGKLKQDTLSWLIKVLGKSGDPRYRNVLDACLTGVVNAKSKAYVEQARSSLKGQTSEPFNHGKLDFVQIKKDLFSLVTTADKTRVTRFNGLAAGKSLDSIYKELGAPDMLTGASIKPLRAGQIRKSRYFSDSIIFKYSGLGKLRFFIDNNKQQWLLQEAESETGYYWSMESGKFVSSMHMLKSAKGIAFRKYAIEMASAGKHDQQFLDSVASRIYASRNETDTQTIEGLGVLCELLANSERSRYRKMLMDVAENGLFSKTRKYALKAAQRLPESQGNDFVPSGK